MSDGFTIVEGEARRVDRERFGVLIVAADTKQVLIIAANTKQTARRIS
jgi:hypothetical protein